MDKRGFLFGMFSEPETPVPADGSAPLTGEIDKKFRPSKGAFFRTLEYPQTDAEGKPSGRVWMEAGQDEKTGSWVLWRKATRTIDDPLKGGTANILTADPLFEKTDFLTAYDHMTTFEESQEAQGLKALTAKTPGKLGGDYYKQFAWREGLMMSRSGRLYPVSGGTINGDNYFDEKDIKAAKEFLDRLKTEQFVPVPIVLPATDWAKAYEAAKETTDERLNVLYNRYGGERDNYDLALQVVGQESPEVLYAHLQRGFKPNIFLDDPEKHFNLLKAAIDRPQVEALHLLTQAGVDFYVRHNDETPLEAVLKQHRYSHLHVMLSREGEKLANYSDDSGNAAAVMAMDLKDRQAFRMLYLEGLDYTRRDKQGWALVHHAFKNSFMPGVYAWVDEGLSIDTPIAGTGFTGLSIARQNKDQPLIDFALKKGADASAPDFPPPEAPTVKKPEDAPVSAPAKTAEPAPVPVLAFSPDLLNSAATNQEIEKAARAYVAGGGSLNAVDAQNVSVLELSWRNRKKDPALDRRALLPVLGKLGADPSVQLPDGTTVLTRVTSASALDMEFLKALAPLTRDANSPDAGGNNLLHRLQMNASEQVGHSNNVVAILKLFPALDINRQNNDGLGNVGLAVRLNRGQTLKNMPPAVSAKADFGQLTSAGWSVLDLAFTAAAARQGVTGAPRADKITAVSEGLRTTVLDLAGRIAVNGDAAQKASLSAAFHRTRPDSKTLIEAAEADKTPAATVTRLKTLEQSLT